MNFTYEDVSKILEDSKDAISNNRNYRILYRGVLQKFWEERINKKIYFTIFINNILIDNIDFVSFKKNLQSFNLVIGNNNIIEVDNYGNILSQCYESLSSLEMKNMLSNISKENCVFFFGEEGISRFINGSAVEDNNIFYSMEDRKKFLEKRDISKLDEVIHDYATKCLTQQINYMSFFADNISLKLINEGYVERNILRNKPEHYMRDHLRQYLNEHMRYTFVIEPELDKSKRRLDIYFDVNGELHLIEIKWLGVSINSEGNGLSKPYGKDRVKQGVIQTLEYIEELTNTSETCLRCGYLAVFDARDKKEEIDLQGYTFVKEELKKYIQNFRMLEFIPLNKKHPA